MSRPADSAVGGGDAAGADAEATSSCGSSSGSANLDPERASDAKGSIYTPRRPGCSRLGFHERSEERELGHAAQRASAAMTATTADALSGTTEMPGMEIKPQEAATVDYDDPVSIKAATHGSLKTSDRSAKREAESLTKLRPVQQRTPTKPPGGATRRGGSAKHDHVGLAKGRPAAKQGGSPPKDTPAKPKAPRETPDSRATAKAAESSTTGSSKKSPRSQFSRQADCATMYTTSPTFKDHGTDSGLDPGTPGYASTGGTCPANIRKLFSKDQAFGATSGLANDDLPGMPPPAVNIAISQNLGPIKLTSLCTETSMSGATAAQLRKHRTLREKAAAAKMDREKRQARAEALRRKKDAEQLMLQQQREKERVAKEKERFHKKEVFYRLKQTDRSVKLGTGKKQKRKQDEISPRESKMAKRSSDLQAILPTSRATNPATVEASGIEANKPEPESSLHEQAAPTSPAAPSGAAGCPSDDRHSASSKASEEENHDAIAVRVAESSDKQGPTLQASAGGHPEPPPKPTPESSSPEGGQSGSQRPLKKVHSWATGMQFRNQAMLQGTAPELPDFGEVPQPVLDELFEIKKPYFTNRLSFEGWDDE